MKIKEFNPVIYPTRLWVVIKPTKEEVLKVFGLLDEDGEETGTGFGHSASSIAQTYPVYHRKSYWKGCLVVIWRKSEVDCGVIAHESSHCADWLADEIGGFGGVEGCRFNTGEPRAYYEQWVANCIDKTLKNKV